jgi:hypothetical protein
MRECKHHLRDWAKFAKVLMVKAKQDVARTDAVAAWRKREQEKRFGSLKKGIMEKVNTNRILSKKLCDG